MAFPVDSPELIDRSARPGPRPDRLNPLLTFLRRRLPLALFRTAGVLRRFFGRVGALSVTSVKEFIKDDCLNLAAQISYYALFSIFPLILGILWIVTIIYYDDRLARANLLQQIIQLFPTYGAELTQIVNQTLDRSREFGPLFFIFFFLGLIWGGTGIFDSLTTSLNKAWQIPGQQRSIFESLFLRFVLFGIFFLLLIGSVGVSISYDVVRNFAQTDPGLRGYLSNNPIWDWLSFLLPWVLGILTFLILYRVVPQRKVTWGDVWPGAVLATILFEVVKIGFTFYVTKVAAYTATYGSLAGVIVFIFWLYLVAIVVLIGGEVSSVYAEMRGDKRPTKLARQGHLVAAPATGANSNAALPASLPANTDDGSLEYSYACEEVVCVYAPRPVPADSVATPVESPPV